MSLYKGKYRIKSSRLKVWDYSTSWWYFVTINSKDHNNWFGNINNGTMDLNEFGKAANNFWFEIPNHYKISELDYYVIMPNHIHGIIIIDNQSVETGNQFLKTGHAPSLQKTRKHSLGNIIGSFKSAVTKWAHKNGSSEFCWQSRFYDRIIRNESELYRIRKYINNNPLQWDFDKELPENLNI